MLSVLRALAAIAVALVLPPSAAMAQADAFPTKPITLIVPFQAGVSVDLLFRGIAEVAGKHLGQPVIVDNKPGASATLGPATMAATAKPDGYTIAQLAMPLFRMPHLQKVTFDPLKDFTWIMQLGGYSIGVVTSSKSDFKTWADVIAFAKANPGKLTYTTPGPVTINSIALELIARQEGTRFAHVPGKGGGEASAAVMGGHVMLLVESPAWAPLVESGELRVLAMLNSKRSPKWPDVPTFNELGYKYDFDTPFGIGGPKGMDPAIVKKLHDAFKKAYDDPKVIELYEKFDYTRLYVGTAEYAASIPKMAAEEKARLDQLGLSKKE